MIFERAPSSSSDISAARRFCCSCARLCSYEQGARTSRLWVRHASTAREPRQYCAGGGCGYPRCLSRARTIKCGLELDRAFEILSSLAAQVGLCPDFYGQWKSRV